MAPDTRSQTAHPLGENLYEPCYHAGFTKEKMFHEIKCPFLLSTRNTFAIGIHLVKNALPSIIKGTNFFIVFFCLFARAQQDNN